MNVLEPRRRIKSPGEYTMHTFKFCSISVELYLIHRVPLIGISDKISRRKFYCTVCITILYFSTWRTGDWESEQNLNFFKTRNFSRWEHLYLIF